MTCIAILREEAEGIDQAEARLSDELRSVDSMLSHLADQQAHLTERRRSIVDHLAGCQMLRQYTEHLCSLLEDIHGH